MGRPHRIRSQKKPSDHGGIFDMAKIDISRVEVKL